MIKFKQGAARAVRYGVLAVAAGAASAHAAAIDTSAVIDAITTAGAAIAVVGAALVAMHYGAKVWQWIRKAG